MVQAGGPPRAWVEAGRALADRDTDLADADRALARAVAGAHRLAVESIGRIGAISSAIDAAAAGEAGDSPAGAREVGRQLVAKSREIADAVRAAQAGADAKTLALRELIERYRPAASG